MRSHRPVASRSTFESAHDERTDDHDELQWHTGSHPVANRKEKETSFQNVSGTRASVAHWLTPCSKKGKGRTASFQEVPGTRASGSTLAHNPKQAGNRKRSGISRTQVTLHYVEEHAVHFSSVFASPFLVLSHVCQSTPVLVSISPSGLGGEALEMVFHASFADFRSAVSNALFHIFVDVSFSALWKARQQQSDSPEHPMAALTTGLVVIARGVSTREDYIRVSGMCHAQTPMPCPAASRPRNGSCLGFCHRLSCG